ncbi:MAG: lysophospholipid acyltransferase family protein [Azonexus sp.]|jgi:KDO2-lipid IV(A) lauroyltransferase|uniref:lysophospholipid acyltransferase family protein n=1 Tax=Azonexus sp. TaxID=1872668 RepID=UPI002819C66D|nr:lysophospholipid acyltransferase family protein [Azonexus sp.]MDR0775996.1 lysophospholipid acyltransferase family protein [Azonexus sp.]
MLSTLYSLPLVALLWLLRFLPLPLLAAIGRGLGRLLMPFVRKRRAVVALNLAWCFPELDEAARRDLARRHFAALGRSFLERGMLWWSSRQRLERLIQVEGEQHLQAQLDAGRPVILLAPHFLGLDAGGVAVAMRHDVISLYAAQRNPLIDRLLLRGRKRFGDQVLLSRQDGVRATVKAMKSGRPFYYLPDLNARRREAVFVPFFGVSAATNTGLPRLARAAGAAVLPCVTRMLPGGEGYQLDIGEAWTDYPTGDVEADIARMNTWLEGVIRSMPEQYYWVHRRFKTRPPGEARPY